MNMFTARKQAPQTRTHSPINNRQRASRTHFLRTRTNAHSFFLLCLFSFYYTSFFLIFFYCLPICFLISYYSNRLQNIPESEGLIAVTLNPSRPPAPELTIARWEASHPVPTIASYEAQQTVNTIQGVRGTYMLHTHAHAHAHIRYYSGYEKNINQLKKSIHTQVIHSHLIIIIVIMRELLIPKIGIYFAGAYMGWGFHEDGAKAGLHAASLLSGVGMSRVYLLACALRVCLCGVCGCVRMLLCMCMVCRPSRCSAVWVCVRAQRRFASHVHLPVLVSGYARACVHTYVLVRDSHSYLHSVEAAAEFARVLCVDVVGADGRARTGHQILF